jgi:hypothetical protein
MRVPPPREWPFLHPLVPAVTDDVREFRIAKMHEAFENHQTASTRLVTTNPTYLMQVWLGAIGDREVRIVATAHRASLEHHAPEALARRGPFADPRIEISFDAPDAPDARTAPGAPDAPSAPDARTAPGAPDAPSAPAHLPYLAS